MELLLDEIISIELKKVIKKGDFDRFKQLMITHKIDASSHLFAKRRSSAWPLLKKALGEAFSNRNYLGCLKIANYLIQAGANINDNAPYDFPPLTCLLNQYYFLRNTKAKYEVFMHTLAFALELARQKDLDIYLLKKKSTGLLDAAIRVYDYQTKTVHEDLQKLTLAIIKELLAKGAKQENPNQNIQDPILAKLINGVI